MPQKILVLDTVTPRKHKDSIHRLITLGPLTPERFKNAATSAYNATSASGNSHILYAASTVKGKVKLIAKLYQAKRDRYQSRRIYRMFAAFHHPDGEIWRKRAKLPKFFSTTTTIYPSRPPLNPDYNTRLRKRVLS